MNRFRPSLVILFSFVLGMGAGPLLPAQEFGFGLEAEETEEAAAEAEPSPFSGKGELSFGGRALVDTDEVVDSPLETFPRGQGELTHSTEGSEVKLSLRLSPEVLTSHPQEVLREGSITLFMGPFDVKTGLFTLTWGKADSLHVLDVINPQDYSDFINQDLEDRKIPQGMVQGVWRYSGQGKIEGVFVPFFTADRIPLTGRWVPQAYKAVLEEAYQGFYAGIYAGSYATIFGGMVSAAQAQAYAETYAATFGDAVAAAAARDAVLITPAIMDPLTAQAEILAANQAAAEAEKMRDTMIVSPDTQTLRWGQGGLRVTDTWEGFDWGLQYYYGYLRTPSFNADPSQLAETQKVELVYNPYHLAGFDLAAALGDFNFRMESALTLTTDWEGNDPLVYNPKASWSAGVDWFLWGVDINLQTLGEYLLNPQNISDPYDVELDAAPILHTTALRLAQAFSNEKVQAELSGAYRWETGDFMISPALLFKLAGEIELKLSGRYFAGDEATTFGQFKDNSYVALQLKTSF